MKSLASLLAALCVSTLLSACAGSSASTSKCDMPYAPVKAGARWVYSMTSQIPTMNGTMTTSIIAATATSYVSQTVTTLHGVKTATTMRTTVTCSNSATDEKVLRPKSGVTVGFNIQNTFTFQSVTGSVLPPANHWTTGYTWVYQATTKAKGKGPGADVSGIVGTRVQYQVQAPVNVVVPFGHFTAIPITGNTLAAGNLNINAMPIAANQTMPTATNYYVKGIGLVKSVSPMLTSELTSYTP